MCLGKTNSCMVIFVSESSTSGLVVCSLEFLLGVPGTRDTRIVLPAQEIRLNYAITGIYYLVIAKHVNKYL